jgi:hypothetical protein
VGRVLWSRAVITAKVGVYGVQDPRVGVAKPGVAAKVRGRPKRGVGLLVLSGYEPLSLRLVVANLEAPVGRPIVAWLDPLKCAHAAPQLTRYHL